MGHIFPTISTAWALRAAGHEVLYASGGHHELVAHAGLPVVDCAPGVDFGAIFRAGMAEMGQGFGAARGFQAEDQAGLEFVTRLFARVSQPFVERTVALARTWRPDLIITTPMQGAGPLAAEVVGAPVVVHGLNFSPVGGLAGLLAAEMAPAYEKYSAERRAVDAVIDVAPPSMRVGESAEPLLHTRYVPYNGGAVLPDWVVEPRTGARIVVTLGSVVPQLGGIAALRPFVAAAGEVDAEFVLAMGGADLSALGTLPDNLRPVDWVPLGSLLRNADAIVHHGGAGTTLTALDAGIPQYVTPQGADQHMNAEAVARRGAGDVLAADDLDSARLNALLHNGDFAVAAKEVSAEMAGQPGPAAMVGDLAGLVR
ncbi:MAG TPA: nucleotide disphospho-sugar-binding domain-containing protein [Pseudonocardiaceae bacterium]|nr:nucleotide disphospho-sugar-binding domain-containing protein [Pseudonocardiaceae bacterium]